MDLNDLNNLAYKINDFLMDIDKGYSDYDIREGLCVNLELPLVDFANIDSGLYAATKGTNAGFELGDEIDVTINRIKFKILRIKED